MIGGLKIQESLKVDDLKSKGLLYLSSDQWPLGEIKVAFTFIYIWHCTAFHKFHTVLSMRDTD